MVLDQKKKNEAEKWSIYLQFYVTETILNADLMRTFKSKTKLHVFIDWNPWNKWLISL